ncbi:restriction endonuclease subunit S [Acinetobacter sp. HZNU-JH01]|uniref:restriction endonuclease subunit S n=1 Tax=Acinetobacter sp. HZNU-JH01 TaxID=3136280 RepID=UPI0030F3FCFB
MTDVKKLITEHLDIWLTAETEKKSGRGRSSGSNDTIYGIQKLRELILELAFLGKLVPNGKKPFNLLEQILSEQNELVKNKILKKTTNINILENSEFDYSLPNTWVLLKLGDSGYNLGQKIPTSKFSYIDVSAINSLYGRVENQSILNAEDAPSRARKIVGIGTVIYSTVRPYLNNIAVIDEVFEYEPIASTAFAVIHPYKIIDSYYLFYYLRSPLFIKYVESQQVGIAYPAINDKQFFSGLLPIPPLEEQKRIVSKVDELMQLCDQLEHQQNLSSEAHDQLVDTLLSVLINSSDVEEFQQNWQRISENFDLLFTTEYSIEQLKQTILQLAVMGKLVKQDPKDEPASELLERIAEEKAKLVKEGKIKKSKPLPEIIDGEKPFELPKGWSWSYLEDISLLITKGSSPKWQGISYVEKGILFITSENVGSYSLILDKKKYVEEKFNQIEPRSILQKNDFLMNIVGGSIGRTAIYDLDETSNINQAVCLLRLLISYLDKNFLLHFFNSEICKNYMFDKQVDNARPNLSMGNIAKFIMPIPPLCEQKRIVEKINQLFSMIEKLRTLQGKLQRTKLNLADSLVANALSDSNDKSKFEVADKIVQFEKPIEAIKQSKQKSTDQIDLFTDESVDDDVKLLSLAAEITFQLHTEPTFGHLKLQKLIYLCQQLKHMDLAADFKQHAAGPYDPVMARYLDKKFKDHEWFSYDPKRDLKYKPLSRCNDHRSAFNKYFAKETSDIYALIGLFRTSKSDHIEIVATLFACWLRLLENKQSVTEEQLLKDFYAWSEEKKGFGKNEVLNGFKWMKVHSITPKL